MSRPRLPVAQGIAGAVVLTACLLVLAPAAPAAPRAAATDAAATDAAAQMGPLSVHPRNPRYFADGSGRAVYLTGSHVWWNLVGDRSWRVQPDCVSSWPAPFDYEAYLDRIAAYGHNFVRLWRQELTRWDECGEAVTVPQHPWPRTGPGTALDGLPRFDLSRWDESYFSRLRARAESARSRGIYVSIMLFEGWSVRSAQGPWNWHGHPFHWANNVNGVNGDPDGNGNGTEIHTLGVPQVRALQEAYVRKVLDTVAGLDNVLFEIVNESGPYSIGWQYHMIEVVKAHERTLGSNRPVGMTATGDPGGESLWRSAADWISPADLGHLTEPPALDGSKVVLADTDHHCGVCAYPDFPWKAFMRGHHPLFMDPLWEHGSFERKRRAMGVTRRVAERVSLARLVPKPGLSSTNYALAERGREYLVYQPGSGRFWVNLRGSKRLYRATWINHQSGRTRKGKLVRGGRGVWLEPRGAGPAVVHLRPVTRRAR